MERVTPEGLKALHRLCPGGVTQQVDLSAISQWQIGGTADLLIRPSSPVEVANLRRWFYQRQIPHVVIGLTSNLLFADEGLRVPCLQIASRMGRVSISGTTATAQAGAWVPGFARQLMQAGLTGAEHICGIPGTLGGLVCMNGGTRRKGIGSNVLTVSSVDATGEVMHRPASACHFQYRDSVYQQAQEVITQATFRFCPGSRGHIRRDMLSILAERRRKFPRKEPNCGSVFKSNPAMYQAIGPPGAAIERLGLKGLRVGGAVISPRHGNFIVNTGGARAWHVLALMAKISTAVEQATGYRLEAEVRTITPYGTVMPAGQVADENTL